MAGAFFMPKHEDKGLFEKGGAPGPGRPPGMKNKSYLNLNVWFELLHDEVTEMTGEQRVALIFRAIDTLMSKVQNIPATPEESRSNADKALDELKAAESYGLNRDARGASSQPGSNGADVETGSAESKASA